MKFESLVIFRKVNLIFLLILEPVSAFYQEFIDECLSTSADTPSMETWDSGVVGYDSFNRSVMCRERLQNCPQIYKCTYTRSTDTHSLVVTHDISPQYTISNWEFIQVLDGSIMASSPPPVVNADNVCEHNSDSINMTLAPCVTLLDGENLFVIRYNFFLLNLPVTEVSADFLDLYTDYLQTFKIQTLDQLRSLRCLNRSLPYLNEVSLYLPVCQLTSLGFLNGLQTEQDGVKLEVMCFNNDFTVEVDDLETIGPALSSILLHIPHLTLDYCKWEPFYMNTQNSKSLHIDQGVATCSCLQYHFRRFAVGTPETRGSLYDINLVDTGQCEDGNDLDSFVLGSECQPDHGYFGVTVNFEETYHCTSDGRLCREECCCETDRFYCGEGPPVYENATSNEKSITIQGYEFPHLKVIQSGAFSNLSINMDQDQAVSLWIIGLQDLQTIESDAFLDHQFIRVTISNNPRLTTIGHHVLNSSYDIISMDFARNRIQSVSFLDGLNAPMLKRLSFQRNNITRLSKTFLHGFPALENLDLSFNHLVRVDFCVLSRMLWTEHEQFEYGGIIDAIFLRTRWLNLAHNNLPCDCTHAYFRRFMSEPNPPYGDETTVYIKWIDQEPSCMLDGLHYPLHRFDLPQSCYNPLKYSCPCHSTDGVECGCGYCKNYEYCHIETEECECSSDTYPPWCSTIDEIPHEACDDGYLYCLNGGRCSKSQCACPDLWTGPECDIPTVCATNPYPCRPYELCGTLGTSLDTRGARDLLISNLSQDIICTESESITRQIFNLGESAKLTCTAEASTCSKYASDSQCITNSRNKSYCGCMYGTLFAENSLSIGCQPDLVPCKTNADCLYFGLNTVCKSLDNLTNSVKHCECAKRYQQDEKTRRCLLHLTAESRSSLGSQWSSVHSILTVVGSLTTLMVVLGVVLNEVIMSHQARNEKELNKAKLDNIKELEEKRLSKAGDRASITTRMSRYAVRASTTILKAINHIGNKTKRKMMDEPEKKPQEVQNNDTERVEDGKVPPFKEIKDTLSKLMKTTQGKSTKSMRPPQNKAVENDSPPATSDQTSPAPNSPPYTDVNDSMTNKDKLELTRRQSAQQQSSVSAVYDAKRLGGSWRSARSGVRKSSAVGKREKPSPASPRDVNLLLSEDKKTPDMRTVSPEKPTPVSGKSVIYSPLVGSHTPGRPIKEKKRERVSKSKR